MRVIVTVLYDGVDLSEPSLYVQFSRFRKAKSQFSATVNSRKDWVMFLSGRDNEKYV